MLEMLINKKVTVFFPDDGYVTKLKCDTCCYVGTSKLRDKNNIHIKFNTLISDISDTNQNIMKNFNKVTQYDVRRSFKDELTFATYTSEQILSSDSLLENFSEIYTGMYQKKGMDMVAPIESMKNYSKFNGVMMTAALSDNKVLCYHVYIIDGINARLWMSCSTFRDNEDTKFRAVLGRANKRLHYEDMLFFQNNGYKTYDWGGISSFEEPNGIDAFKMSFGGIPKEYYDETCICSLKYKLLRKLKKLLRR